MRPVARIAQSVEQGIENPRVLGSIPSPGTTHLEPSLRRGFLLSESTTCWFICSYLFLISSGPASRWYRKVVQNGYYDTANEEPIRRLHHP